MHIPGVQSLAGLVLAAVALAACNGDGDDGPGNTAQLRVVHADASTGPINVEVAGEVVLQDVTSGTVSAVTTVPSGSQHVVLRSGGQVLGELDQVLSEQVINSLLVSSTGAQFADQVIADTGAVATDRANIRMVNVVGPSAAEPTLLEAKMTAPAPDSVMTFGIDTRIARYGPLMYFDPGEFNIKFQPAGSADVLAEVTFSVAAGETRAVVLERAANGDYTASVVVEE